METGNIKKFLAANYSDKQLAALLVHTGTGKLCYNSCCCLVGIPLATHALRTEEEFMNGGRYDPHHLKARLELQFAEEAEKEFKALGDNDEARRRALLPLIYAETERRYERHKDGGKKLLSVILDEMERSESENPVLVEGRRYLEGQ